MHLLKLPLDIHCCTILYVRGPWYPCHGLFGNLGPKFFIICLLILASIFPHLSMFFQTTFNVFYHETYDFDTFKGFLWGKKGLLIFQVLQNTILNY
jgi:hypothetical protein